MGAFAFVVEFVAAGPAFWDRAGVAVGSHPLNLISR
jgi:hypothetical protein